METTLYEKELLRTIIARLGAGDRDWLAAQAIDAGETARYWILNYLTHSRTEYNRLVRGLVVEKPAPAWSGDPLELIRSFPFTRFFNQGEEDADAVDLSNAEMLEKLDGAMIGVFFPAGDPARPGWHTRKMAATFDDSAANARQGGERLLALAGRHLQPLAFTSADASFTYVFELLHPATRVLTRYRPDQFGLYLIGGRHVRTHRELSEDALDDTAARIGVRRPRRWDAVASHEAIAAMMKDLARETPDFEGFVFRDRVTGKRIKLKDPQYVKSLHLRGAVSYRTLLPAVLQGEEAEVLAYFPFVEPQIAHIQQKYRAFVDRTAQTIRRWRGRRLDRKALALEVFGPHGEPEPLVRSLIMKLALPHDGREIEPLVEQALRELALGRGGGPGCPRKLLAALKLDEDDYGGPR